MQIFLWLLYVSSAWFSFYDFILSLTQFLQTWLLSNLTQITMNTKKSLGWREIWTQKLQHASSINDTCLKLITSKHAYRFISWAFSHNKASTMPLFHNLNLLTLNDVFKLEIAKVMHNIENNEACRTIFKKILNE